MPLSQTPFCFVNISAPLNHTEMVLYSKFAYGSWFSGEKNDLKILHLVAEILGKNPVSFFWSENFLETRKFYFTKNFSSKKNVVQKNLGPERFGSKEVCSKKFH